MNPVWKLPHDLSKPLWILVIGTSTTRGLFFESLDLILNENQVDSVGIDEFWKCWGYLDFRVGNFRISYRDHRGSWGESKLSPGYQDLMNEWLHQNVCPNKRKTEHFPPWADTIAKGFPLVPDVVVAESPLSVESETPGCFEEFEVGGGLFVGISHKQRGPDMGNLKPEVSAMYETAGRHFLEVVPMARAPYNKGRSEPNAADIHYVHTGHCYSKQPNITHVCSAVLEMELFMLMYLVRQERSGFYKVANPEHKAMIHEPKPATICHQCPTTFGLFDVGEIRCHQI